MKRLTEKQSSGFDLKAMNGEWCNKYCEQQRVQTCNECGIYQAIQKLAEYEDAEEQGLLLRLPCGIGADVYIVPSKVNYELNLLSHHAENNRVYHQNVNNITFTSRGWYMECDKDIEYGTGGILSAKFYKETWFLSLEEAEQKLKEMESD